MAARGAQVTVGAGWAVAIDGLTYLLAGIQETILAAGVRYVLICLATLGSRSVRDLQRAEATPELR